MNPRYQKPRILKDLHLFDVDCSTHEHEVTFSNIEDHLNLKKNLEIFLKCIDLFGWPQKLAVTFANQDSSSKVEKKRSEEIQKATKSSRVNPPKSTSQEYLFSSFKRNEQRFINAELQSVVKPHELRSYKEWQGHFGKSPLNWEGKNYNPQLMNNLRDCRCKMHVKSVNYDLFVHQIGDYIALSFCNDDAPLDLLNTILQVVKNHVNEGAVFKNKGSYYFMLENIGPIGIVEIFRCFSGAICDWESNFDPNISGITMSTNSNLPNLSYLKKRLPEFMQLAEEKNFQLEIALESSSSGISPYKYIILDKSLGDIYLRLTRVRIDELGYWSISFEHNQRFFISDGPEINNLILSFNAKLEFVPD